MLRKLRIDPFENVGANQLATTQIRPSENVSLYGIVLVLGGTTFTVAHLSSIRVKIGGKDIIPAITGTRLQAMALYDGAASDTAHVPILFGDPTAQTRFGRLMGCLDMTVYRAPVTIEVQIGGATAPTLQAYALVEGPKLSLNLGYTPQHAALFRTLFESVQQPSGALTSTYSMNLGTAYGSLFKKLAVFHANLTAMSVKRNGFYLHENVNVALNDYIQQDLFYRATQSGLYVFDAIEDNFYGDALPTIDPNGQPYNFSFELTTSAADTLYCYADCLASFEGV